MQTMEGACAVREPVACDLDGRVAARASYLYLR